MDPWSPLGVIREQERTAAGGAVSSLTVLLAGAECPYTCVFCDLWKNTLDGPTPPGALPQQLAQALSHYGRVPPGARLKLYNASNFFEERAVPAADLERLAGMAGSFDRVVVECHPRLVDDHCAEFAARLEGDLEVAMGLECVHPEALPRFNKQMSLEDWNRAAARLETAGIPFRAFVLISPPFVPQSESVDWTLISTAYALDSGAETVTLIPLRVESSSADLAEPSLEQIELAFARALDLQESYVRDSPRAVLLDTWDLDRFAREADCAECREPRLSRLRRMNLSGERMEPVACEACSAG